MKFYFAPSIAFSLYSTTNMRILEKMVRRGLIGLSVAQLEVARSMQ